MGATRASINLRYNCLNSTFFTQTLLSQMCTSVVFECDQEHSIHFKIRRPNYNIGKDSLSPSLVKVMCIQEKVSSSWYMSKLNYVCQEEYSVMRF